MIKIYFILFFANACFASKTYFRDNQIGPSFFYNWLPSQKVELTTLDGATLKGVIHLQQKHLGAQTVVLNHGLLADLHSYDHMAEELYRAGFNVVRFNIRGHGGRGYRSVAARKADHGFDQIVAFDKRAIFGFAQEIAMQQSLGTESQFIDIGHSLGTMTDRLALSGVTIEGGKVIVNEDVGKDLRSMVKVMISYASPADLEPYLKLPFLTTSSKVLGRIVNFGIYSMSKGHEPDQKPGLVRTLTNSAASSLVTTATSFAPVRNLMKGVVNPDNLDPKDVGRFLMNSAGGAHSVLLDQIVIMAANNEYASQDGNVSYPNLPIPADLQTIIIFATDDTIALPHHILIDQKGQPLKDNIRVIEMKGFGHTEVISGPEAIALILKILKGIQSEGFQNFLGPSHTYKQLTKNTRLVDPLTIQCLNFY